MTLRTQVGEQRAERGRVEVTVVASDLVARQLIARQPGAVRPPLAENEPVCAVVRHVVWHKGTRPVFPGPGDWENCFAG